MKMLVGLLFVGIYITGCVLVTETTSSKTVYAVPSVTQEKIVRTPESCLLVYYDGFIKIPELPDIPREFMDNQALVETALVKSINDHREILKKLKKELERCKTFN